MWNVLRPVSIVTVAFFLWLAMSVLRADIFWGVAIALIITSVILIIVVTVWCVVSVAKIVVKSSLSEKDSDMKRGVAAEADAAAEISEFIEKNSKLLAEAFFKRGYDSFGLKLYLEAISDFEKSAVLQPKTAEVYKWRGYAYFELGKYADAIADFSDAIALDCRLVGVYMKRGQAYDNLREYKNAIEDFDKAIDLDSGSGETYRKRGSTYCNLREHEKAILDFDRAISLNPGDVIACFNKACICSLKGDKPEMLKSLKQAIRLNPLNRQRARTDNDFKPYWEDEDFKNLVD